MQNVLNVAIIETETAKAWYRYHGIACPLAY